MATKEKNTETTTQGEVRLKLVNLRKEFAQRGGSGVVAAVDNVSLDIYRGEFVTLLGPSGCGKTTTLRLIAGFETPTAGKILLDNQDITPQPPNKRDMALVFQNYALFPHMTVYDNIAYGLHTHRVPRAQVAQRVENALKQMGLDSLGARKPNQLSGGQQQRVALARSLVMEPRILLFDEPLSNLDAKLRVQMRSEIHRLQRRLGITSIYVTHDQVEAMALSDRVVVMNNGNIEQMGSPEAIYRRPVSHFVADFIGRANFIDVEAKPAGAGALGFELFGRYYEVTPSVVDAGYAQRVSVMLRPEALSLSDDPSLPQGYVEQTMYMGAEIEYVVNIDGYSLMVSESDLRSSRIYEEGQRVGVSFNRDALHLLPS